MCTILEISPFFLFTPANSPQSLHLTRFDQLIPLSRKEQNREIFRQCRDVTFAWPNLMQEQRNEGREER